MRSGGGASVELAPNPTQSDVFITLNTANEVRLNICDMYGRVLKEQVVAANLGINTIQLSTADLANGVYFVNVNTAEGRTNTVRFVKQ